MRYKSIPLIGYIALISTATIVGAWGIEALGYRPCELCLKQRWAYEVGGPLSWLLWAIVHFGGESYASTYLYRLAWCALVLLFLGGMLLGIDHVGLEWGLWSGPLSCTGSQALPNLEGFLAELQKPVPVRCDNASLYILGLSLSAWNVLISFGLMSASLGGLWASRPRPPNP